ncbi:MFS transporter [Sulfurisphaera javensis]|uniref:MFS transporter n=1 Tax=Sulfurisphaera javensis TaxID=2049879 RepID=A0AAT9GPX9_9CREN
MKPLRTYTLLNNLASSLVNPFISFFTASYGISGVLLAMTTSASIAFPGIVQFLLTNLWIKAKKSIILGTLTVGILWLTLGLLQIYNSFMVLLYIGVNIAIGIINFGWLLILDKISETSRGRILASFNFYSTIGGLIATFITGFIVKDSLSLMRYFFITSGIIYIVNSYIISKSDIDVEYPGSKIRLNDEIKKFFIISFLFTFVWSTAWPLFPLAQVYKFHMNELQIAIIDVIGGVSTLSLSHLIGRLVDKFRTRIMFFGRMALATFPLAYALSPSVNYIYLAYIISGFTNSASISYTAFIFDNSTKEEKKSSIALYNLINGISALTGSSISSIIFSFISATVGIVTAINLMLLSIGILRIITSFLYLRIKELHRRDTNLIKS